MSNTGAKGWGLEVVRGREVGRVYPLGTGPSVLGGALNGEPGIDLGAQEGPSPRRMAARQARLERSADGLTVVDLDSPGGTFVNRERVLAGQARRLEPGDVIQVGAVQLKVVAENGPTPAPAPPRPTPPPTAAAPPPPASTAAARPGALARPFVTQTSGATCRTWDDFLTLSAQSWTELSDELQSGRLGSFLKANGRDDLVPPVSSESPDERLDAWLGRLPTTRPAVPDLDVHPAVVRVRGVAGGGTTRTKVVITNTGYRLLRSTLRLEPPETAWVRIPPAFSPGPFTVAETVAVPLDVELPESLAAPRSAFLVIEGNGGSRRVEIRAEPPVKLDAPPEAALTPQPGKTLREVLAGRPPGQRIVGAAVGLPCLRVLLTVGDLVAGLTRLDDGSRPSLSGGGLVMAAVGAIAGVWFASRRGEARDLPPAAFAGGFAGVLVAALAVAASRAVEPVLGGSTLVGVVLWAAVGAVAGLGSLRVVPYTHSGN